jgi:hypothetical protein
MIKVNAIVNMVTFLLNEKSRNNTHQAIDSCTLKVSASGQGLMILVS